MRSVPCPTCPWRRSATVGGFDIPNFNIDRMRGLTTTVGPGDGFRPIMACHYSPDGGEQPCIGYVAVEGGVMDACAELDLWPSFAEMLAAYETAAVSGHREESHDR